MRPPGAVPPRARATRGRTTALARGAAAACLTVGAAAACAGARTAPADAPTAAAARRAPPIALTLEQGFRDPPMAARPKALWSWANGNFSLARLTYELEEGKRQGLGGFDIWDVGLLVNPDGVVPAGPPFLGDASVHAIGHAVREATRLGGLELGLVISSSWNAGGPWVRPEHGVMGLFRTRVDVAGPRAFDGALPFPALPDTVMGRRTLVARGPDGLPTFRREVAVLAYPVRADSTVRAGEVVDLTSRVGTDGRLRWQAPAGRWRVVRYVCAPTGQPLVLPSPRSDGRMLDHFSAAATDAHLSYILGRLHGELGPSFAGTALRYLYTDSYEANSAAWTPRFPEEFRARRGYPIAAYLPALDGFVVGDSAETRRFLFDFRKTLSDLIVDNHYARAREASRRHGLGFYAEAGGPGPPIHNVPFEDLRALGALDVPRGEFWNRHPQQDELQVVKGIASAAHLYNQPAVEAEAFTSVWMWQEGPAELKPLADRAFAEGLNRIVYHTFPHTPPEGGEPGGVYNFGTLVHPGQAWWPKSASFHRYLARVSWVLQQGHFVGDVLRFYGDQAPNFVGPKRVDPALGAGYDYDVVNAEVLAGRLRAAGDSLVLPHGQSYQILTLPDTNAIAVETLRAVERLVFSGATVVGPRPDRAHGLRDRAREDAEVRAIAARLWGPADGRRVTEHRVGRGRVVWGKTPRQVLQARGLGPDLSVDGAADLAGLDFIHRRTPAEDVYFVRNTRDQWIDVPATFRVRGRAPELWDPVSGDVRRQLVYDTVAGGTRLPVRLAPYGSAVVVFRAPRARAARVTRLAVDGAELFPQASARAAAAMPVDVRPDGAGDSLVVWRNGVYRLTPAGGAARDVVVRDLPAEQPLGGPWEVRFPHGWDAPASTTLPRLASWTDSPLDAVRHFSGVATYHTAFDVPAAALGPGRQVRLELGAVREVADVYLNGRRLGAAWTAPYALEATAAVRPGVNHLVVEVANTLNNRLVGDARRPAGQRRTKTNITRGPNPWMKPWAEVPLQPSGLLGPVRLRYGASLPVGAR